ncbi:response regulator transcription factor [Saccharopolyspora sp. NFXS83]|uniref:LuxR C-terminal-related transcriptional regulator n=1 Tax=Saccharopolyspora sp. NFXS83 TaxID=2993560 RepID=UPI00224B3294|nr:response regulator transcription factor [Saccharopolyspora sp. NFXS83]MCX2734332.1 response regulator transcription factor [Saccharopolyspora sp. NFXS83]
MIEVAVIAPNRFYREGLALILRNIGGFRVIAAVSRPEEIAPLSTVRGVILLDVVDSGDGLGAVSALAARNPGLPIVVLGVSENEVDIIAYAEMGAAGYLTREQPIAELGRTIESAATGELRCSPRVAAALSHRVAELTAELRPGGPLEPLSGREAEITELLEQELSNQEISRRLCIALPTVKNHVHHILDKLGLRARTEAASWARRQRLNHSALIRSNSGVRANGAETALHRADARGGPASARS